MASQGKRMVPERLIKEIGQGGAEYTAGTGIDITEDVISVDTETVAMKTDLATVATTGDYDDLTNKPTIPTVADVTSQITSDAPINKANYSGGAIKFQLLKDDGSLETNNTKLTLIDGISGKYLTEYTVIENTDYTVSGNTMNFTSTDFQNAVCRTLVAAANHNHTFGWKVNAGTSSGIASGTPTVSSNTYTYTGNFSFVFTDNLDGTFTITTPLSITLTVAPTTDVVFSRFTTAANLTQPIDAKFIPIDNSTITVDTNGKLTASGGSGSSYTFTNGLTESSGTVSWDLNNQITSNNTNGITIKNKANSNYSITIIPKDSDGTTSIQLGSQSAYGVTLKPGRYFNTAGFYPSLDDNLLLGTSTNRWRELYVARNISDGTNSVAVANIAQIDKIAAYNVLPDTTTDGTYVLKATVSSGVVTYAWVLEV